MHKLVSVILFSSLPAYIFAQQPNGSVQPSAVARLAPGKFSALKLNYVRLWEPSRAFSDPAAVGAAQLVSEVKQTTTYIDGLGRPLQKVSKDISPLEADIVQPILYDKDGRETVHYLPYTVAGSTNAGGFRIDAITDQALFLQGQYPGEQIFYGETEYERSPLGRMSKNMAPGNSWAGSGKGISSQYLINMSNEGVKIWDIGTSAADYPIAREENYGTGKLYKDVVTDEAGHEVVSYKNKEGLVVLKKVQLTAAAGGAGHDGWLCTYYVYDKLGNLRYVIPPKAVEILSGNGWSLADAVLREELCFRYVYDHKKRLILKQIPGAGPVEMVYDLRDRLVFTQDGNMRPGKWLTTFYDELNRPVMTALYSTPQTAADLTSALESAALSGTVTYEVRIPAGLAVSSHDGRAIYQAGKEIDFLPGFDSNDGEFVTDLNEGAVLRTEIIQASNPLPNLEASRVFPLTYTYYDHYNYGGRKNEQPGLLNGIPHSGQAHTDAMPISGQTRGLMTGTKVRLLQDQGNNDRWLVTSTYYDAKGRVLQVLGDNATGGEDIISNLYNFNGQVLSSAAVLRNPKSAVTPEIKLLTMMEYDHGGRLVKVRKKVGDNGLIVDIATSEYDALGQLKKKTFKRSDGSELESLEYDYNIRGWLKAINKKHIDNTESHYFGQELSYDYGFSTNQLNGNIAGIKWKAFNNQTPRAYGYSYDGANRLLKADFTENNGGWAKNPAVDFDVKMGDGQTPTAAYDANGNILGMQQSGIIGPGVSGKIDDLTYSYLIQPGGKPTNKLQSVTDGGNNSGPSQGDFREQGPTVDTEYGYDANGNMRQDDNKGISNISYNHLNLPGQIDLTGKGTIRYVYDATGVKHQKIVTDQTGPQVKVTTTDYSGGLVYEDNKLQLISHEEGRIRLDYPEGQPVKYTYDYFVKDHLGNVRAVLTEGSEQQLYLASMEAERAATENALFNNIESSRSAKPAGYPQDATAGSQNAQVAKLNGNHANKRVGPSLVLKVMAGDTISIGAKAFYKSIGNKQDKSLVPAADMASSLLRAFGGGQGNGEHKEASADGAARSPFNEQFINDGYQRMKEKEPADPAQAGRPKAYLNFALFDDQFNLVEENSGVKQVKAEPDQLQTLAQDKMVIKTGGFLYVYTSNETPQDVFFDNLTVVTNPGALLEETHYYPFGLTMSGISAKAPGKLENRNEKFQGQPLDDELGLNWYGFKWRNHDPQIGRFIQVDPLSDKYVHNSTYAFSENKVTAHVELEGLEAENFMSKFSKPKNLPLKTPDPNKSQVQLYQLVVKNPSKSYEQFRDAFLEAPQDFLTNSKATFNKPVDGDGNESTFKEGNYIKIDIDGPMNNSYVKIMDINSSENATTAQFQTVKGHIEKGVIQFGITKSKDGAVGFSIVGMSQVDMGLAPEGFSRKQQKKSWEEVLQKVYEYLGGEEVKRETKVFDNKKDKEE